jgi:hypothetical protein
LGSDGQGARPQAGGLTRQLRIAGALLLAAAGLALAAVWAGRASVSALIAHHVYGGSNSFCVALPPGRGRVPGQALGVAPAAQSALAAAGLLDAEARLTDSGWEQTDLDDEDCLVAGRFRLELESLSPKLAFGGLLLDVRVRPAVKEQDLAAWARHPAVRQGVPEVAKALSGETLAMRILLVARAPFWQIEPPRGRDAWLRAAPAAPDDDEDRAWLRRNPPPDKSRLTEMFTAEHADWMGAKACIGIASLDPPFPADEVLIFPIDPRVKSEGFAVAIYEFLERDGRQQLVLDRTLPRLRALERAGVLVSSETVGPKFRGQFPGRLYVPAPGIERYMLRRFGGGCLYGGVTRTEVTAAKFKGARGKLIAKDQYTAVASWAQSEELLAAMPDLRKVVDRGVVCMLEVVANEPSGWKLGNGGCS